MLADQQQFGLGKTTAEEMARVMEGIYRCGLNASAEIPNVTESQVEFR